MAINIFQRDLFSRGYTNDPLGATLCCSDELKLKHLRANPPIDKQ